MSVQVALDNVSLRPTSRWAHTEYSLEYHKEYVARRAGESTENPGLMRIAYDLFCFDFLWSVDDGMIDWHRAGRTTDAGHLSSRDATLISLEASMSPVRGVRPPDLSVEDGFLDGLEL